MAKFYGAIGYVEIVETKPGVFRPKVTEQNYAGDLLRNIRSLSSSEQVNDDINIGNEIHIVADAYVEPDLRMNAIEHEVFPMRNWDYNHIVGFIRIGITKQDVLFDVFLPVPLPKRYVWSTPKKLHVQNISVNGTHIYLGSLKTNTEIRDSVDNMLTQVTVDHIPSHFYVDREGFDTINEHLDYLSIIHEM